MLPTLGGAQIWADEYFFHGWHIQVNVLTGHYRLLDEHQIRHAWGSFEHCRQRLDEIRAERKLPTMQGKAVVLLHGMFRNNGPVANMARFLHTRGDYAVFNLTYPSNWWSARRSAAALAKTLASLEGIEEINFVCHSFGNIVVRHYLADCARGEHGGAPDPRIRRMVMLGPPNQGSKAAQWPKAFHPLDLLVTGKEIRNWAEFSLGLATPTFEFGVIAGGLGQPRGFNPLLREDNDFIVTVESTRLAGATDFAVLPVLHAVMGYNRRVQEYTLNFLRDGYFISAEQRQPIAAPPRQPA
jgi:pimeloyl-ACP methyl ester carboxylesterase